MLEYDFDIFELYEMTPKECVQALKGKQHGLGYRMWRLANLIGASFGKEFPKTPEDACPELFPKPVLALSDELMDKLRRNRK